MSTWIRALGNQLWNSFVTLDAERITIDLDPARDPTRGSQQLSLITAHFDSHSQPKLDQFEQARAE